MLEQLRLPRGLALLVLGFIISTAVFLTFQGSLMQTLELKTRDARFRILGDQGVASDEIIVVEIDGATIKWMEEHVGRWPWPRAAYVEVIDFLHTAGAKAIAFDIQFTERDRSESGAEMDQALVEATQEAGNVVHVMLPRIQTTVAPPTEKQIAAHSISRTASFEPYPEISMPYAELGEAAAAVGHVAAIIDSDGPWRSYLPMVEFQERLYPSLALVLALRQLGLKVEDIEIGNREIRAGEILVPLDADWRLPIWYHGGPGTYSPTWKRGEQVRQGFSFVQLLYSQIEIQEGTVPDVDPALFKDKIVLIGVTEPGLHDVFTTPYSGGAGSSTEGLGDMAGVEIHANVVDSMLNGRYLRPLAGWTRWLIGLGVSLGGLALIFYLGLIPAVAMNLLLITGYLSLSAWLFSFRWELPILPVAVSWVLVGAVGLSYQYWIEGAEKRRVKQIFSKFVSKDVYQRLLQNPGATELGGQRAEVTVLFSDLRGFTSMSEGRSPEDVVSQLNEYFTAMVDIVFRYQGTVDKFVGDMIMALFNTPLEDPLHADHALCCGMEMQQKLVGMNETWKEQGLPELHCGVGLNSGEMVAGIVGAETVRSYTVIGDNVNLGARLESLCKEYKSDIIISDFTRSRLTQPYPLEALGEVLVKGKSKPVEIFRVNWREWEGGG